MNIGDLILHALISVLLGMLVYIWFLSNLIPSGQSVFEIQQKLENASEKLTAP
tara:strand:- start:2 stop:160 length:159 start_codon:yes stop_codon:yes gene_type:complete